MTHRNLKTRRPFYMRTTMSNGDDRKKTFVSRTNVVHFHQRKIFTGKNFRKYASSVFIRGQI